jgi:hypothetical protein
VAHNVREVDIGSILDELVGDGVVWRLSTDKMQSCISVHVLEVDISSLLEKIECERDATDGAGAVQDSVSRLRGGREIGQEESGEEMRGKHTSSIMLMSAPFSRRREIIGRFLRKQ